MTAHHMPIPWKTHLKRTVHSIWSGMIASLIRVAVFLLRLGPIPKHVAFIMDGNRRFARRHQLASVVEGHDLGFRKMEEILDHCMKLGVQTVTVYAFSIENFRRPPDEVDALMDMAARRFDEFCGKS